MQSCTELFVSQFLLPEAAQHSDRPKVAVWRGSLADENEREREREKERTELATVTHTHDATIVRTCFGLQAFLSALAVVV